MPALDVTMYDGRFTHANDGVCGGPSNLTFLWLEITQKCNLECVHCYANSGPRSPLFGTMTTEDWMTAISDAYKAGCSSLQFIGGEPTLHPALHELITHARTVGFDFIEVFTNATALTERRLGFFCQNKVSVATSFYSSRQGIHERITRRVGSFEKTVAGIKRTVHYGIPIRVGIITQDGLNSGLSQETITYLNSLGVDRVGEDHTRQIGRAALKNIKDSEADYFNQLCGQCWKGSLCVTSDGSVYPCVFSKKYAVGNLAEASLYDIAASGSLSDVRALIAKHTAPPTQSACNPAPPCTPQVCHPQVCQPQVCGPVCFPRGKQQQ